jgi:hypothetical protein
VETSFTACTQLPRGFECLCAFSPVPPLSPLLLPTPSLSNAAGSGHPRLLLLVSAAALAHRTRVPPAHPRLSCPPRTRAPPANSAYSTCSPRRPSLVKRLASCTHRKSARTQDQYHAKQTYTSRPHLLDSPRRTSARSRRRCECEREGADTVRCPQSSPPLLSRLRPHNGSAPCAPPRDANMIAPASQTAFTPAPLLRCQFRVPAPAPTRCEPSAPALAPCE